MLRKNRPDILAEYGLQLAVHELVNTGKRLRCVVCYKEKCQKFGRKVATNRLPDHLGLANMIFSFFIRHNSYLK